SRRGTRTGPQRVGWQLMPIVIRMPEVITGVSEAALQSWLVAPGDEVAVGQPIAEVETEKATVEFAAEEAGTPAGPLIGPGVQAAAGAPTAVLATAGASIENALAPADTAAAAPASVSSPEAVPVGAPETPAPVPAASAEPASSPTPTSDSPQTPG